MASWHESLVVDEQHDDNGDIVYCMSLRTSCRATIDRLADLFGVTIVFRTKHVDTDEWSVRVPSTEGEA